MHRAQRGATSEGCALSLFLLRILSGAAKTRETWEIKRALLVGDRAPREFKEQALGSRRAERASPEKADTASKQTQYQARGRVRVVHVAFLSVHEREVQKKNVVGPPELARCASYM